MPDQRKLHQVAAEQRKGLPGPNGEKSFFQLFDSPVGMDGSIDDSNHKL
jgi:hypothetical protein